MQKGRLGVWFGGGNSADVCVYVCARVCECPLICVRQGPHVGAASPISIVIISTAAGVC